MSLFETGPILMTYGIKTIMTSSPKAQEEIQKCLKRHISGDWGDLCDDDKKMNQDSIQEEKDNGLTYERIFSCYKTNYGEIYIITEADRSSTTILLPEEY